MIELVKEPPLDPFALSEDELRAKELDRLEQMPPGRRNYVLGALGELARQAKKSRVPGEEKPRTLLDHSLKLSAKSIRATPRPRKFLLRDSNTGEGRFVQGKVGIFAAAGGTGKTYSLTQLAVSCATGATWYGPRGFTPDHAMRVLALLAEDDHEEAERRVHFCARAAGLGESDLELLAENLTAIPLAIGLSVALTSRGAGGILPTTDFYSRVRELLVDALKAGKPYELIVIDPLARFSGPDVEKDNECATRWVECAEALTIAAGGASMLIAHHTKKAGKDDDADSSDLVRGASALVNGVRWVARLEQQKRADGEADLLALRITKANGIKPQFSPLYLVRDMEFEGCLRIATRDEIDSNTAVSAKVVKKQEELESIQVRVLKMLEDGNTRSRNDIAAGCKGSQRRAILLSIQKLVDLGQLEAVGSGPRAGVRSLLVPPVPEPGTSTVEAPRFTGSGSPISPFGEGRREPVGAGPQNHSQDAPERSTGTGTGTSSGTDRKSDPARIMEAVFGKRPTEDNP